MRYRLFIAVTLAFLLSAGGLVSAGGPLPPVVLPELPPTMVNAVDQPVQLPSSGLITADTTMSTGWGTGRTAIIHFDVGTAVKRLDGTILSYGIVNPPKSSETDSKDLVNVVEFSASDPKGLPTLVTLDKWATVLLDLPSGENPANYQPLTWLPDGRRLYLGSISDYSRDASRRSVLGVSFTTEVLGRFALSRMPKLLDFPTVRREFVKQEGYHSAWAGQSPYVEAWGGQVVEVQVRLLNTGHLGWHRGVPGKEVRLGSNRPTDNELDYWRGILFKPFAGKNRFAAMEQSYVGPGEVATFSFQLRAPDEQGVYQIYLRPVIDGTTWLEDEGIYLQITVK